MNYITSTLQCSRTFHEATGQRLSRSEFDTPNVSADKIVFWSCVAIGASLIIAALCGVKLGG